MSLRDRFHSLLGRAPKEEVVGTRVLVCGVGNRFGELVREDAEVYRCYHSGTTLATVDGPHDLIKSLGRGYDIVHLLCVVNSRGTLADSAVTGTELIDKCCSAGVSLLWIASDNAPDGYVGGFQASGKHINLVMTIKRDGPKFTTFLGRLLFRMSHGVSMPVAWNDLCPQIPGAAHSQAPEQIFFAGGGAIERPQKIAVRVPKPVADLGPALLKYKTTYRQNGQTTPVSTTTEIQDAGENWLVTEKTVLPAGEVVDETTVQKRSLIFVRRRHTRAGTVTDVAYCDKRVTGAIIRSGQERQIDFEVDGPLFAAGGGSGQLLARLPLAPGYRAAFHNFSLEKASQVETEIAVTGAEKVTVPAGEFDAWLVDYSSPATNITGTFWIDKAQPRMVKFAMSAGSGGGNMTMELE